MPDPSERGGSPEADARVQILVAEYTWVAGLIRYYREVELKALAGTGLVLSGVGAAFAALAAADSAGAEEAIGLVFAIGAWVTSFLLPVVIMANMRGMRAVVYVREWLHPLAAELAGDPRFLAWEAVAMDLYSALAGGNAWIRRQVVSAAVIVALIGAASLALVAAAWTVHATAESRWIAGAAAVCDLWFMGVALRFANRSALRGHVGDRVFADAAARAAESARRRGRPA